MTSRKKLTEAVAATTSLAKGKTRAIVWDTVVTGFGLRCSVGGGKSFVLVYRPQGLGRGGASRTLTLGRWPELGVEAARKAARAKIGEIAHGKDPAVSLREGRHTSRSTLGATLNAYEASLKRRRAVNVQTVVSSLRRGLARLTNREVGALTRADYVAAIESLEGRGKSGAAEYLRKNARTFAEWAVTQGRSNHNPLAGLRRPKATRAERLEIEQRGRALSSEEITALWTTAAQSVHPIFALIRLGLLTGMRRGELAGLSWSSIRADRIVLEATHTKQGRQHEIPLTPAMRNVLAMAPTTTSQLVFPSVKTGGRMSGWKKLMAKVVKASGVTFSLHDLRRTCRTLMSDTGTSSDIAEIAIGHQRDDLIRRYDFSAVWPERTKAFVRVSEHIAATVAAEKGAVVTLASKQGGRK